MYCSSERPHDLSGQSAPFILLNANCDSALRNTSQWIYRGVHSFGYEITYWQPNRDVYEYLSEAFDVNLYPKQAYLITDQPLKVTPLGVVSD